MPTARAPATPKLALGAWRRLAGIRLALSKQVGTYLAVDYALGLEGSQGSQGVFFNLGDVF